MLLEFLRHGWKSNTFWQVWKGVNELSLLYLFMIERATISILTLTSLRPIFAGNRLVIRVNCSQSSLTKVLWKRIIWLSQIFLAMGKLTVLLERARLVVQPMSAELSFILLLESIELTLISVEIVVVRLLSQVTHDLSRWVVEIPWTSICIITLALIARFLTRRIIEMLRISR
jgi:hypothetical protein